jgi:UDP-N-acetylglucosamine acyltransferase
MISPLAFISPNAQIGTNVTVEPFACINNDTKIGDGTHVYSNAVIMPGARIGRNCKIFPGAVISAIPQDLKFKGEETTVEIGDNTVIREFVTINRGTNENHKTVIGANCLLMAYVHIAHDCEVGNYVIMSNYSGLAGHVKIEDYVVMEAFTAVQQFLKVGAHAFIAAVSKARKNVPPYVKAAREPLSFMGVNTIGLARRGFSADKIKEIEEIYRTIYLKGLSMPSAIKAIETEIPDSIEKTNIIEFINNSKDGIMKGPFRSTVVTEKQ